MVSTSASRTSAIYHLDIEYKLKTPHEYIFKFLKRWKKGVSLPRLVFHAADKELGVMMSFDVYLSRTKIWRINKTLSVASIDTEQFQGYSTRSALTSKAILSGLALSDILVRGQWSRESTWCKFFNKSVYGVKTFRASVLVMKK